MVCEVVVVVVVVVVVGVFFFFFILIQRPRASFTKFLSLVQAARSVLLIMITEIYNLPKFFLSNEI